MGTQVATVFGGELFRGSIVGVDEDEGDGTVLYHIEYEDEDEDQEDLSSKDCADAIKLHRQIENGETDEWVIIDNEYIIMMRVLLTVYFKF